MYRTTPCKASSSSYSLVSREQEDSSQEKDVVVSFPSSSPDKREVRINVNDLTIEDKFLLCELIEITKILKEFSDQRKRSLANSEDCSVPKIKETETPEAALPAFCAPTFLSEDEMTALEVDSFLSERDSSHLEERAVSFFEGEEIDKLLNEEEGRDSLSLSEKETSITELEKAIASEEFSDIGQGIDLFLEDDIDGLELCDSLLKEDSLINEDLPDPSIDIVQASFGIPLPTEDNKPHRKRSFSELGSTSETETTVKKIKEVEESGKPEEVFLPEGLLKEKKSVVGIEEKHRRFLEDIQEKDIVYVTSFKGDQELVRIKGDTLPLEATFYKKNTQLRKKSNLSGLEQRIKAATRKLALGIISSGKMRIVNSIKKLLLALEEYRLVEKAPTFVIENIKADLSKYLLEVLHEKKNNFSIERYNRSASFLLEKNQPLRKSGHVLDIFLPFHNALFEKKLSSFLTNRDEENFRGVFYFNKWNLTKSFSEYLEEAYPDNDSLIADLMVDFDNSISIQSLSFPEGLTKYSERKNKNFLTLYKSLYYNLEASRVKKVRQFLPNFFKVFSPESCRNGLLKSMLKTLPQPETGWNSFLRNPSLYSSVCVREKSGIITININICNPACERTLKEMNEISGKNFLKFIINSNLDFTIGIDSLTRGNYKDLFLSGYPSYELAIKKS